MATDRETIETVASKVDYGELWELIAVVGRHLNGNVRQPARLHMGQLLRISYPMGEGPVEMVLGPVGATLTILVERDAVVTRWKKTD